MKSQKTFTTETQRHREKRKTNNSFSVFSVLPLCLCASVVKGFK